MQLRCCAQVLYDAAEVFHCGLLLPSQQTSPEIFVKRKNTHFPEGTEHCLTEAIVVNGNRNLYYFLNWETESKLCGKSL